MTLGMAGYVVNDSLIKLAAENLPLFQAIVMQIVPLAVTFVAARVLRNR